MSFLKIRKKGEKKLKSDETKSQFEKLPADQIGISDQAEEKIEEILKNQSELKQFFRIAIKGGGCSGLSIHFEFCNEKKENDHLFEKNSVKVLIDKKSLSLLGGSTLHYKNYFGSGEFSLENNPAAKQCSCGKSFSL